MVTMNPSLRTVAGLLATLLAGCASVREPAPPAALATAAAAVEATAPNMDLGSKFRVPNRERGRRSMALMNRQYQLDTESNENGPPTAAQLFRAQEQRHQVERVSAEAVAKSAGIQPAQWQSIGPGNVAGRVRAIAFDPSNTQRVLIGTASGGLWISDDTGASWRANHDFLPNLSISTIAFNPVDARIVYLGTGEGSAGLVGVGAFKSVDGGATWVLMPQTNFDTNADWRFVNRIAVHPTQPSVLLAGVTNNNSVAGAIYRSADAGATWTRVATMKALDIAFEPSNPANALAGLDDGTIAFSRDAGVTWTRSAPLLAADGSTHRAEIAFARSAPGVAYASFDHDKGEVWRSADSGATWTKTATTAHLASQGDYDNAIWVDPTDAAHVMVAGLDIYQSLDSGVTFNKVSDWTLTPESPHADHHALVSPPDFGPARPLLFNGNDGGIYRAANVRAVNSIGQGWANLNNGLGVTQFYSGAGRAAAGGRVIGGTQDNGSLVLNPATNTWSAWRGGDGGFVAVDPTSDQLMYGELYYLAIFRSNNGGGFAQYICTGITEAYKPESGTSQCGAGTTQKANFIAPFILDPNTPARMLAGANSLWVSDNVRQQVPAWRVIKQPSAATDNFINAIAVREGDGNLIWIGHNNGEVYKSTDGLATTPTWTRVGQGVLPGRRVQRIMVDRENPQRVIVALTGFNPSNLWQTTDGGATWASITGNLPDAPIFDVKRHARNAQWLYVATSVGVFTSENGGASWATSNEGPANIRVRELFWIDDNTLGAATYGRGMFKIAVNAAGAPNNYTDLWWAGTQENGWGMSITQHGAKIFAAMYIYDPQGRPVWAVLPDGTWNAANTTYTGALYAPTGSWFGNYDASRVVVGASIGTASLNFDSLNSATLTYTINGVSGTKSIQRQAFGPRDPTPVATYTDLWWGGLAQNGWGVAISQQYRTIFAVWYTYDSDGRTIWYVVPGGEWTAANVYRGTAYRTTSSPWLGTAYNPAAFVANPVGTLTFTFNDLNNAVMSYTIDGVSGSKPITRQPF